MIARVKENRGAGKGPFDDFELPADVRAYESRIIFSIINNNEELRGAFREQIDNPTNDPTSILIELTDAMDSKEVVEPYKGLPIERGVSQLLEMAAERYQYRDSKEGGNSDVAARLSLYSFDKGQMHKGQYLTDLSFPDREDIKFNEKTLNRIAEHPDLEAQLRYNRNGLSSMMSVVYRSDMSSLSDGVKEKMAELAERAGLSDVLQTTKVENLSPSQLLERKDLTLDKLREYAAVERTDNNGSRYLYVRTDADLYNRIIAESRRYEGSNKEVVDDVRADLAVATFMQATKEKGSFTDEMCENYFKDDIKKEDIKRGLERHPELLEKINNNGKIPDYLKKMLAETSLAADPKSKFLIAQK